jgi:CheY-like chemotaxis protein
MTNLLLVEPAPDLQRSLVELLQGARYGVVAVRNGGEALRTLGTSTRPSVIILDVTIPIVGGADLAAALATDPRLREIPVIVLSTVCGQHRDLPPRTVAVLIGRPLRAEVLLEIVDRVVRPRHAAGAESQAEAG